MLWCESRSGMTLLLGAVATAGGCTLIGGTDGLYIVDGGGGEGAAAPGGSGGVGSTSSSSTSSSSTSGTAGAGGGSCVATQCPGTDTQCAQRACVDNACALVNDATGTSCTEGGGKYCDGAGTCVPCINNTEYPCDSGTCQSFTCVGPSCTNGIKDSNESDTDCGGVCGPCPNNMQCGAPGDCQSRYCASGYCSACSDQAHCPDAAWYCDLGSGTCADKKPWLAGCTYGYECQSNSCNGVWCQL